MVKFAVIVSREWDRTGVISGYHIGLYKTSLLRADAALDE
jgi:hypothetical protein